MSNYKNPARAMVHPEADVQVAICEYLQLMKIYFHSVPNERKCSAQAMGRLKAMGLRAGTGDLLIFYPNKWKGHEKVYRDMTQRLPTDTTKKVTFGYIEAKAGKGVQSDAQKRFELLCKSVGTSYDLAYSIDDVKVILEKRYNITL